MEKWMDYNRKPVSKKEETWTEALIDIVLAMGSLWLLASIIRFFVEK